MKPIMCNYYVTLRCNSRCEFCDIWMKKENFTLKEQNLEDIDNNLKSLKKLGVKIIDFTGGEPLLYPNLVETLKLAKKYKFYTTTTTNGILYPKYAEKLNGLVDLMAMSLDAAECEKHDKVRGVKSFDKVVESIKLAKKIKQKLYLIHTVTDENCNDVDRVIKFAQDNKCTIFLNPCFAYFNNKGISKENASSLKKYFKEPYVCLDLAQIRLIEQGGNDIKRPVCKAISSTVVISPDNYLLLPCYHFSFKKIKIEKNLYELYHSKEVRDLAKQEGEFNFCQKCTIYCYMKTSFYRNPFNKYFPLYLKSGYKFLREKARKQF